MAKTETAFIVIKADRSMRLAKKPRLSWDEVAVRVNVSFSDSWGRVIGDIDLDAPEFDPNITYAPVENDDA